MMIGVALHVMRGAHQIAVVGVIFATMRSAMMRCSPVNVVPGTPSVGNTTDFMMSHSYQHITIHLYVGIFVVLHH